MLYLTKYKYLVLLSLLFSVLSSQYVSAQERPTNSRIRVNTLGTIYCLKAKTGILNGKRFREVSSGSIKIRNQKTRKKAVDNYARAKIFCDKFIPPTKQPSIPTPTATLVPVTTPSTSAFPSTSASENSSSSPVASSSPAISSSPIASSTPIASSSSAISASPSSSASSVPSPTPEPESLCVTQTLLYNDSFSNNSLQTGGNGISWQVENGTALESNSQLVIYRNNSRVLSTQNFSEKSLTIKAQTRISWSSPSKLVFLYQDIANHYFIGISGSQVGLYRVLNNTTTRIDDGYLDKFIRIHHASGASRSYKIFYQITSGVIRFKIDSNLLEDGTDFEYEISDSNQAAVTKFASGGKLGFIDYSSVSPSTAGIIIPEIDIYGGCHAEPARELKEIFVSDSSGNDLNVGTSAQPLKTIKHAASLAKAGDQIKVFPGVYSESNIKTTFSGKQGLPIKFIPTDSLNKPIITGALPSTNVSWQNISLNRINTSISRPPGKIYGSQFEMQVSQYPNSSDPENPDYVNDFLAVPNQGSNNGPRIRLIDSTILSQYADGSLIGGTLTVWDNESNSMASALILDNIASTGTLITTGVNAITNGDKYVIRNLKELIDVDKEYSIDAGKLNVVSFTQTNSNLSITLSGTNLISDINEITLHIFEGNNISSTQSSTAILKNEVKTINIDVPTGMTTVSSVYASVSDSDLYEITARIPSNTNASDLKIAVEDSAFNFSNGNTDYIEIDGFKINYFKGNAINVSSSGTARNIVIKNCEIHNNGSSGVSARTNSHGLKVVNSKLYSNFSNGISIGGGENYLIDNNEIYLNEDNGIWLGNGGTGQYSGGLYHVRNVLVSNNYIHDHISRRRHPDGFQCQQVDELILDSNVFEQPGHQNMWLQYNGKVSLINNIYRNGPLGVNSVRQGFLFNNTFYNSTVRFDSWQDREEFQPRLVEIRGNTFIGSGITRPPEHLWPALQYSHNFISIVNGANDLKLGYKTIVNSTPSDANSLNNYFVSVPSNFNLKENSPLIDKGYRKINFSHDMLNQIRFQGTAPDIGALEYSNTAKGSRCNNGVLDLSEEGIDCGGVCKHDDDNDGFHEGACQISQNDCNDEDASINPSFIDLLDGVDRNCDGRVHQDCDLDYDNDSIKNCNDNCPSVSNVNQNNRDSDLLGDACDNSFNLVDDFEKRNTGTADLSSTSNLTSKIAWTNVLGSSGVVYEEGFKRLQIPATTANAGIKNVIVTDLPSSIKNYTFEVKIAKRFTIPRSGIVLHYESYENYYLFDIRTGQLVRYVGGVPTVLATNSSVSLAHNDNEFHTFSITAMTNSNTISFTIKKDSGTAVILSDTSPLWLDGVVGIQRDIHVNNGLFKITVEESKLEIFN